MTVAGKETVAETAPSLPEWHQKKICNCILESQIFRAGWVGGISWFKLKMVTTLAFKRRWRTVPVSDCWADAPGTFELIGCCLFLTVAQGSCCIHGSDVGFSGRTPVRHDYPDGRSVGVVILPDLVFPAFFAKKQGWPKKGKEKGPKRQEKTNSCFFCVFFPCVSKRAFGPPRGKDLKMQWFWPNGKDFHSTMKKKKKNYEIMKEKRRQNNRENVREHSQESEWNREWGINKTERTETAKTERMRENTNETEREIEH